MWVSLSLLLRFPPACGHTFLAEGVCLQAGGERGKEEGEMGKNYFYVLASTLKRWGVDPSARVVKIGKNVYLCEKVPPVLLDRRQKKEGGLYILRPLA